MLVNAVSRTRFFGWGAIRKHTTDKAHANPCPGPRSSCTYFQTLHLSFYACKSKCTGRC